MHSGVPHPHRTAPRDSDAYRRPVRIHNIRLRENDDGSVDIKCDLECSDMWRFAPDDGPGNFSAVWLFLKTRSAQTRRGLDEAHVVDMLAPTKHLPRARAAEVQAAARTRLHHAFLRYADENEDTMLGVGPVSFGIGDEEEDAARVFINVQKQTITSGASPGATSATRDTVAIARYRGGEGFLYDCKTMGAWQHGLLSHEQADYAAPDGWEIVPTKSGHGVFLQPSADNIVAGPVHIKDVVLRWQGDPHAEFPLRVWVHGLEMIYIPEGAFELGDPAGIEGPTGCFHARQPSGTSDQPNYAYEIKSEQPIPVFEANADASPEQGLTWDNSGQFGTYEDIPATFPKGHRAFYVMRRQATQGEYCDFMNNIAGHAKTARFPYGGQGQYRYTIYKTEGGLRAATRPNRANNWMSWADALTWVWWAGLRPMTEFEYEKAARGFGHAVSGEYAWGSTVLEQANVIVGSETSGSEYVTGNANLANPYLVLQGGDGGAGPCRDDGFGLPGTPLVEGLHRGGYASFSRLPGDGSFTSAEPGSMRDATGMSYFGVFGLTGNLWEFTISAGHPIGRAFNPIHGDGELNRVGLPKFTDLPADQRPWPNPDGAGAGFRGGSWYTDAAKGRMADRGFGSGLKGYNARSHDTGVRGVRTSPEYDE